MFAQRVQEFASSRLPYGYSSEPSSRTSNVSIDDIIYALQTAKDAKTMLEKQVNEMKINDPKPIDLNQTQHSYIIASRLFASSNVWQPQTSIIQNENIAKYELNKLRTADPNKEYKICTLSWSVPEDDKTPIWKSRNVYDEGDTEDEEFLKTL